MEIETSNLVGRLCVVLELEVILLSVCLPIRLSHACFVASRKINLPAIFFIPHEGAILVVKCDFFSYSYAAADKISTDLRRSAVPLR